MIEQEHFPINCGIYGNDRCNQNFNLGKKKEQYNDMPRRVLMMTMCLDGFAYYPFCLLLYEFLLSHTDIQAGYWAGTQFCALSLNNCWLAKNIEVCFVLRIIVPGLEGTKECSRTSLSNFHNQLRKNLIIYTEGILNAKVVGSLVFGFLK